MDVRGVTATEQLASSLSTAIHFVYYEIVKFRRISFIFKKLSNYFCIIDKNYVLVTRIYKDIQRENNFAKNGLST